MCNAPTIISRCIFIVDKTGGGAERSRVRWRGSVYSFYYSGHSTSCKYEQKSIRDPRHPLPPPLQFPPLKCHISIKGGREQGGRSRPSPETCGIWQPLISARRAPFGSAAFTQKLPPAWRRSWNHLSSCPPAQEKRWIQKNGTGGERGWQSRNIPGKRRKRGR